MFLLKLNLAQNAVFIECIAMPALIEINLFKKKSQKCGQANHKLFCLLYFDFSVCKGVSLTALITVFVLDIPATA